MKIYHLFQYDRSLKVRWLAKELDLPIEEVLMQPGEHQQQPFTNLNPYGLVPTLEKDNGESLFESGAICLELCQMQGGKLINQSSGEFNQWLFYFASTFDNLSGGLIGLRVFGESAEVRERIESRLPGKLAPMEAHIANKAFWFNDEFSLIDIFAWQNLAYLYVDGQLANYPNLVAYVEKIAKRPALAHFTPENLLSPPSDA